MNTLFRLFIAAVLGILVLPRGASAGPVWSLQWEFGTSVLVSNSGRSYVSFTPKGTVYSDNKDASVVIANVGVTSNVPPSKSDSITHQNYGMLLKLTNLASDTSAYIWFSGSLTGQVSQHSANLTNHFNSPSSYDNIRLGNEIYSIRIGPFVTPNSSNHFNGTLSVYVDPQPVGTVNATPEPSGLLLGSLGLVFGVPLWRRRRTSA